MQNIDLASLDLDSLIAFSVFAETLNFTRTAERLHISQPALHVKIRKLAANLRRDLYQRRGRSLVLTTDGIAVGLFARQQIARTERFLDALAGHQSRSPLVLAAGQGAFLYVIAEPVRRILADGQSLRLLTADGPRAVDLVRTGLAHLGVATVDVLPADLESAEIAAYPQVVIAPTEHPLATRDSIRLLDLDGQSLVVTPPEAPHRRALTAALREAGASWEVAVEANGWDVLVHFVHLGAGIAVVNGCVQVPASLVTIPVSDLPRVRYTAFCRIEGLEDPRVVELRRLLLEEAGLEEF